MWRFGRRKRHDSVTITISSFIVARLCALKKSTGIDARPWVAAKERKSERGKNVLVQLKTSHERDYKGRARARINRAAKSFRNLRLVCPEREKKSQPLQRVQSQNLGLAGAAVFYALIISPSFSIFITTHVLCVC